MTVFVLLLALAQPDSDRAATVTTKQAFEEARREYQLGNWAAAVVGFERAYRLSGDPTLLYNCAQAHRQAGNTAQALAAYKAYLRDKPDAPNRAGVEVRIRELEAVKPGPPVPSTATPAPSDIADPFETGIYARPAAPARESSTSSTPSRRRTLVWIGAGATVAFTGGAVLAGLAARSRFDDLRGTCGRTGCSESEIDTVKSRALAANVLWALAGVSAAATGVVFYLDHRGGGLALTRRF